MKKLQKIIAIILVIITILTSDLLLITNCVQAQSIEEVTVYDKMYCDKVLIFSGYAVGSTYVVYNKNGVEYPAYCIDPNLPGVGEIEKYNVTVEGKINDVGLWRVLINGYPYKTIEELGVANEKEAYLATKQAVYCHLKNRDTSKYSAKDEAGYRTLNALNQILNNARSSTEEPPLNHSQIIDNQNEWEQDKDDKRYVAKTYEVKSSTQIKEYKILINGENIPEGIKITDTNNNEKENFKGNEKFKILIPIYNLDNNGNFEIKLKTEVLTKPILYGVSGDEKLQNYALTAYEFEESEYIYNESYGENKTTINILKQDKTTKEAIAGTEFQVLNEKKEIVYTNLVTDVQGQISIKSVLPGKYYLKETRAVDGYIIYDELIEINIELNETINIIVNNSKEKKIEISNKVTEIEVEQEKKVKKLPITGM